MRPMGLQFLHIIAVGVIIVGCLSASVPTNERAVSYFLPRTSIPNHYDINLNVDISENSEYSGNVNIDITVIEATTTIVLNANKLIIDVSQSDLSNGTVFKVSSVDIDTVTRLLTLNFGGILIKPGDYVLTINFKGDVYSYANGLFQSYYTSDGKKKQLLATQFEPVQAREMFPCYDEPNLKSTFKLSVEHPSGYTAISNMPAETTLEVFTSKTITVFQKTPPMSSYLLALAVSDFQTLEDSIDNVKVRLFVAPNEVQNTKLALNITKESIRNFHEILKVRYALPKLDGIAVPTFGGGMENWGLIVYDKSVIMKSSANINNVCNLIVHEIAHQWFGNLVTLDWWDYVWLNEGFATYYAQRVSDIIIPEGRFEGGEVLSLQSLMKKESYNTGSKALNAHIEKPSLIMNKFDSISYHKGAAIVRFMALTFNGYDDAISQYLNELSYKNAKPSDLFKYLDERNQLPLELTVEEVMSSWINNPGFPLVTYNVTSRGYISTVVVSQERFLLDGQPDPNEKWSIPITMVSEKIPQFENAKVIDWLRHVNQSTTLYFGDLADYWIIANIQQAVYCRVNYDLDNWSKLIAYLNGPDFEKIHYLNRAALLNDASYLVQIERLPQEYLMNLLKYLKQETDELVLNAVQSIFVKYSDLLRDTTLFQKYKTFVQGIFSKSHTEVLLKEMNISDLIKKATIIKKRHENTLEDFNNLANRLYKSSELKEALKAFKLKAMGRSANEAPLSDYDGIIDELKMRAQHNQKVKKEFMQKGYNDMKNWLEANTY